MTELIKAYRWPIIGGLVGLLLAVLIITIGFLKTLVILIFVALGIAVGYYIEKTGVLSKLFK
ncbi:DUF2273 domain-containing protein [Liquorilactobacillus satsumensis]|uniref:DUF2273 domain-containing protein n=1 Tax=Liquorilactobacillus TaxID=2767888 RepID=UPI0006D03DD7|nr:DUF2273 domain-containing protein [Liquorilactobacillus satsumensis]MCC7667695.1 DUF2273 domain-containing protein [Liquorilactobacillus satsumensis]MCP9313876.1 DUF2273 domain-containing protein [Liquorilactobacillus satsumensis]MCP9329190.1 DUF2273 domain-containing protein [Liquorilactobacillus satsumensis]MCP9357143.1 DUF2273 domain-containing protein [Liquorilactobacillus satsumensis]MCP9361017.1 DUF2273 domain-containing protein [Liquorilactobacillus satsumensis]